MCFVGGFGAWVWVQRRVRKNTVFSDNNKRQPTIYIDLALHPGPCFRTAFWAPFGGSLARSPAVEQRASFFSYLQAAFFCVSQAFFLGSPRSFFFCGRGPSFFSSPRPCFFSGSWASFFEQLWLARWLQGQALLLFIGGGWQGGALSAAVLCAHRKHVSVCAGWHMERASTQQPLNGHVAANRTCKFRAGVALHAESLRIVCELCSTYRSLESVQNLSKKQSGF